MIDNKLVVISNLLSKGFFTSAFFVPFLPIVDYIFFIGKKGTKKAEVINELYH